MFVPSSQAIIAIGDAKSDVSILKEFEYEPNDKTSNEVIQMGKRELSIIHSENLYELFFRYIDTCGIESYEVLKGVINKDNRIKLYYVTPKELMKLAIDSNISMSVYNSEQCINVLTNSGDIIILFQAIKYINGVDHNLFKHAMDLIAESCLVYIIKNEKLLSRLQSNDTISNLWNKTKSWYRVFINLISDKYDMYNFNDIRSDSMKTEILDELSNKLFNIIHGSYIDHKIPVEELLNFFRYEIPKRSKLLKDSVPERDKSKDLIEIRSIGRNEHKDLLKLYLKQVFVPIRTMLTGGVFQPDVILANQEFYEISSMIKTAYERTDEQYIDMSYYIKKTMMQEFYNMHTIPLNFLKKSGEYKSIMDLLVGGDIFDSLSKSPQGVLRISKIRALCTEISGLSAGMVKYGGEIEEIELSKDDGTELLAKGYTSSFIRERIKNEIIKSTKKLTSVSDSLCRLVDSGVITPVMFTDNDSYGLLVEQSNDHEYEKRIMGFYENERNRIFLLLNNVSIGATGSISNSNMLSLIIHELMHYAYQNNREEYLEIFNEYIMTFYKDYFDHYYSMNIPEKFIKNYVNSLYKLEKDQDGEDMINALNCVMLYAQKHGDENHTHIQSRAFEKLFSYLSGTVKNETGVKISQISRSFFNDSMVHAYRKVFAKMNPEMHQRCMDQNDSVIFSSVFYQEFIATSEVAAMVAGTLIKEMYKQQMELSSDNPIATMINSF